MKNNKLIYALIGSLVVLVIGIAGAAFLFFNDYSNSATSNFDPAPTAVSSIVDDTSVVIPDLKQNQLPTQVPVDLENIVGNQPSCATRQPSSGNPFSCTIAFNRDLSNSDIQNIRLILQRTSDDSNQTSMKSVLEISCQAFGETAQKVDCKTDRISLDPGTYSVAVKVYEAELKGFGPDVQVK